MSDVEFVESLPAGDTKWAPIAAELRDQPGVWALIGGQTSSRSGGAASNIKRGTWRAFPPAGAYEARYVNGQLYARYVGGES